MESFLYSSFADSIFQHQEVDMSNSEKTSGFLTKRGIVRNAIREDVLYFAIPAILVFSAGLVISAYDGFDSFVELLRNPRSGFLLSNQNIVGLSLIVIGYTIAIVAVVTLRRSYASTLVIREDHQLITHGIYRFTRHPVYLGVLMVSIGMPVFASSLVGLLTMSALIPIFLNRIRMEERMLTDEFGDAYRMYRKATSKLIPYLEVDMNNSEKTSAEVKSNIGVGASIGSIAGAVLGAWFFRTSLAAIITSAGGAALGAAIGSRSKSQVGQYIWFTYSKAVAIRMIVSTSLFLILFLAAVFSVVQEAEQWLKLVLASAASISSLLLVYSVGYAIKELDDLLKKIILESLAVGSAISFVLLMALGIFSLVISIPFQGFIALLIVMVSWLAGRFIVARRYR
jgi:protein-S-isoprenylcysteine O-methyltransferase Ste14